MTTENDAEAGETSQLPEVRNVETVRIDEGAPRPKTVEAPEEARPTMEFFGAVYPKGMANPRAGYPVVVRSESGAVGLVLASDPGYVGAGIKKFLADSGRDPESEQIVPTGLTPAGRLAVARTVVAQRAAEIDVGSALGALGITRAQLG